MSTKHGVIIQIVGNAELWGNLKMTQTHTGGDRQTGRQIKSPKCPNRIVNKKQVYHTVTIQRTVMHINNQHAYSTNIPLEAEGENITPKLLR